MAWCILEFHPLGAVFWGVYHVGKENTSESTFPHSAIYLSSVPAYCCGIWLGDLLLYRFETSLSVCFRIVRHEWCICRPHARYHSTQSYFLPACRSDRLYACDACNQRKTHPKRQNIRACHCFYRTAFGLCRSADIVHDYARRQQL